MVTHNFPPAAFAGVELHVYNLARILSERHQVHVLYRIEDKNADQYAFSFGEYEGVQIVPLVNNLIPRDSDDLERVPGVRKSFSRILDRLQPELVHFHHLMLLSTDLVDEANSRGIPTVASLHDYWYLCCRIQLYVPEKGMCKGPTIFRCADCFEYEDDNVQALIRSLGRFAFLGDGAARFWMKTYSDLTVSLMEADYMRMRWPVVLLSHERRLQRMRDLLSMYDFLIANSSHLRCRYVRFGAPALRTAVIRYGIDKDRLAPHRHEPAVEVRFGYIGSIVEHKGLRVMIEAFRRVPEASLKIFGDADANPAVREFRAALDPPANVHFMGRFDNREIGRVFSGIDVLLVPSVWEEAYGINVDEAKVAGVPVIASRVGGIPEHLKDGEEGYLFTPGSVDELENLIRRLAGRPDRVAKLRPSGDDVATLYENADDIEEVYRSVLSGRD